MQADHAVCYIRVEPGAVLVEVAKVIHVSVSLHCDVSIGSWSYAPIPATDMTCIVTQRKS